MSEIFYHVDRRNKLKPDKKISLSDQPQLPGLLHEEYSEGLSSHGNQYLLSKKRNNSEAEWFYELIRLWKYNDRPSRFQSFFAFETIEMLTDSLRNSRQTTKIQLSGR